MEEKKKKSCGLCKRLCTLLVLGGLLAASLASAVPVTAAAYGFSKHWYVEAGQCFHLMNNDIAKNKITDYNLYVQRMTADARYDITFADANKYSNGEPFSGASMLKGGDFSVIAYEGKSTYLKSAQGANQGMVACIKVTSGRVRLKVRYSANYAKASFKCEQQSAGHQPMRGYKVAQGNQIHFQRQGCDVDVMPVLVAAPANTTILQKIPGNGNYTKYTFNSDDFLVQFYANKTEMKDLRSKQPYSYTLGSKKYILNIWPESWGNDCNVISKKGTVSCYYPTDYFQVRVTR